MIPPHGHDQHLEPFAPAAVRSLVVFGAPVELAFVPARKGRRERVAPDRPAFAPSPADRIVAEEALWHGDGLVVTANRFPFARDQRILWPAQPRRDPDLPMWTAACAWADAAGGTVLVNNIGSAATIARAHAHLLPERLPFLSALAERPAPDGLIAIPDGVELVQKDAPFCLLGARGPAAAKAAAILRLADARLTAAWNVVVQDGTAWLCPRRIETPAPHFPYALGAAEVWGRWCFLDREPFEAATGSDLGNALTTAGAPPL